MELRSWGDALTLTLSLKGEGICELSKSYKELKSGAGSLDFWWLEASQFVEQLHVKAVAHGFGQLVVFAVAG